MSDDFDILIKNATIVDGTGEPSFKGVVAVKGDRIEAVGRLEGDLENRAENIIDANGLVTCPGFIDVHNHGDLSILHYPEAPGFLRQGITTFIGGNCGTSPGPYGDLIDQSYFLYDIYQELSPDMYYPERLLPRDQINSLHGEQFGWEIDWGTMAEFFQRVEAKGLSPNYVPIVGHGDIRYIAMGHDFKRNATEDEISEMLDLVRQAMEDGCRGISVGRDYDPGIYAGFDEVLSCAKVAAEYGGVYTSHSLRTGHRKSRRPGEFPTAKIGGILEAIDVGRKAKIPVQISHLSPLYDVWPGGSEIMTEASIRATLKAIDEAREEGVDVNFDLIPHHLTGGIYTSAWLVGLLNPWLRLSGGRGQFAKALRMKQFREEIKEKIWAGKWYGLNPNINPLWATGHTVVCCEDEKYLDKTIAEIANEIGLDPLDALFEVVMIDPDAKAVRKGDDDWAKLMFYRHPEMMIGIDTFALDEKWETKHPPWFLPNENSFGGFPRYFRRAYRETGTLSIEEVVRKVTSLPARKFKLTGRGVLEAGAYADIVVMNPETVTDKGDQLTPRRYPEGIEHVIVNGTIVVENSGHTGARPGTVLRIE